MMSRFFFALAPGKTTREKILDYRESINLSGKMIPPANLHLTLLFLGKLSVNQQQSVIRQANKIPVEPFELELNAIGAFKQNIVWMGMQHIPEPLLQLQKQLVFNMQQTSLSLETRKYQPHVTLVRKAKIIPSVLKILKQPEIHWSVNQFVLYESVDTPSGVCYQQIKVFS